MSKIVILAIYDRARNASRFLQYLLSSTFEDLVKVENRIPFLDPVSVRSVIWAMISAVVSTMISTIVGGASYSLKRLAELLHDDSVDV